MPIVENKYWNSGKVNVPPNQRKRCNVDIKDRYGTTIKEGDILVYRYPDSEVGGLKVIKKHDILFVENTDFFGRQQDAIPLASTDLEHVEVYKSHAEEHLYSREEKVPSDQRKRYNVDIKDRYGTTIKEGDILVYRYPDSEVGGLKVTKKNDTLFVENTNFFGCEPDAIPLVSTDLEHVEVYKSHAEESKDKDQ